MSKHWKPGRPSVALKPSRIRREPVQLEPKPRKALTQAEVREREVRGGIAGVLLMTAAIVVATVGISAATYFRGDPAARTAQFGQCYNSDGSNCVLDGNSMLLGRERIEIAGIDAPRIHGARCEAERTQGIDAAVRLADFLNSGAVAVGGAVPGPDGVLRRKVEIRGHDVADRMIDAGVAHRLRAEPFDWCAGPPD